MPIRARLTTDQDGALCLESSYDRQFVEDFKAALPWDGRKWDAARKRWIVAALYTPDLLQFLRQAGATVQDDRDLGAGPPGPPGPPMPEDLRSALETLHLTPTAPIGAAEAVYRFYVKYYHPDVGGTVDEFGRVSNAIRVIRQYLIPQEIDDDSDLPF